MRRCYKSRPFWPAKLIGAAGFRRSGRLDGFDVLTWFGLIRATLLARETACLSAEHRAEVDRLLAGDVDRLERLGDNRLVAEAKKLAYRLDPASALRRTSKAAADRRVSIRPAPDTVAYVTALLPVAQGVAVHTALSRHADSMKAQGDPRTRGQLMADALFTDPVTGQLAAMDARRRYFTAGQRQFFVIRDQICRTPWCDAPVRHADHVVPVEDGGETSLENGQGLCEACNHAKQATGWRARPRPSRSQVETTTPTGHRYVSEPPPLPGHQPPARAPVTALEDRFRKLLTNAA